MEDVITIVANLSTKGFEKGSSTLKKAINSLSASASKLGKSAEKSAGGLLNTMKRLLPTIIGVGSAYQIISRAVNAFMAQNEQLSQKMSSVWTALGNLIGPIIAQLITWVTTAVSYLLSFLKLLGLTGKTASQLSKSAKGAGSELQKTSAGCAELNVLSDNSGGKGGATLDDIEPSEWMKKLADLLKKGLWDEAADLIVDRMNGLINTFVSKSKELGEKAGYYLGGALRIAARLINDIDWNSLGKGIANFFNGVMEYISGEDLGTLIVGKLVIAIGIVTGFLENLDFRRVAEIISGIVKGALNALTNAISHADWRKIGAGIRTFFENIDWAGIAEAIFGALKEAWNDAIDLLWGLLAGESEEEPPIVTSLRKIGESLLELWSTISSFVAGAWETLLKPVLSWSIEEGLPWLLDKVADGIRFVSDLIANNGPVVQSVLVGIGGVIASLAIAEKVSNFITTIGRLWAAIAANPIAAVIILIAGLVAAFINAYRTNDEFRQKVDEAWSRVKEVIGDTVDWVKEKFEQFKEKIDTTKEKIADFRDSIVEKFESIKQKAQSLIDKIKEVFSFEWKIPHIKLPHITVTWEPTGDFARFLGVTALPHLGVEWYKRGGIINGAHLIGAGEDGAEAIVPLERNTEWINMVANGLIEAMKNSEFSFDKIGSNLAALNNIAETVAFKMPTVAQGNILPYSVASSQWDTNTPEDDSWIIEAIEELGGKLDTLIALFDTFQFVADFGDQIRALARRVTKEQKRDIIQEGR